MSATLNFNPTKYISWKGKIFYQTSSFIKENKPNQKSTVKLTMKPLPLKIYRREIASSNLKNCNDRISLTIDELSRPNSTIVSGKPVSGNQINGLVSYKTNDITECVSINNNPSCINMPDVDARRRVRSAGMVRPKYNVNHNNDTYCTSSNQYLVSRNRTFSQNQYNFIRQGNTSVQSGSYLSKLNVYSPYGLSHCVQPYISIANQNNTFSYKWVDNILYSVVIPDGQYDIYQLNSIFKNAMIKNKHYFTSTSTDSKIFLLNMAYDDLNKKVILQTFPITDFLNMNYSPAAGNNWFNIQYQTISFEIPSTNFQNIIGFHSGSYSQVTQSSNIPAHITQNYVTNHYKPNNPQFAQQGAVSSSALVARKRYDTITVVGSKMKSAYGNATANALAYNVSDHQYTIKDRIGFPMKKTPVISKYSGKMSCVNSSLTKQLDTSSENCPKL